MRIRLTSSFDWRIPGKGLSHVAFPAGEYAVGIQDEPGHELMRMTRQQADDAIAAGFAVAEDSGEPVKKGRRNGAAKHSGD